ncbi:MAG TPA: EVE domain-containing protein [Devosia sp.]|nr:EVE domain-containing protein [Devosia sp.]
MGTPAHWIGVAARAHVMVGVAEGFVMFAHGKHSAVKQVQPGDWFAYYSPTETLGGTDTVRRFTAIGQVLAGEPVAMQMGLEDTGWRRAARFIEAQEADIYPLLPQLSFVTNPSHWGMFFRKSLFRVGPADFRIIATAMDVQTLIT